MSIGKGLISALGIGRRTPSEANAGTGSDGSVITKIKQYSVSVDPASLAAATGAVTSVTVTGVTTEDVIISCEAQAALNNGISYSARVSAANTVAIHFVNVTAGAIDVSATTFKITCMRIPTATR